MDFFYFARKDVYPNAKDRHVDAHLTPLGTKAVSFSRSFPIMKGVGRWPQRLHIRKEKLQEVQRGSLIMYLSVLDVMCIQCLPILITYLMVSFTGHSRSSKALRSLRKLYASWKKANFGYELL